MNLEWTETGRITKCVFHQGEAVDFRLDEYGGRSCGLPPPRGIKTAGLKKPFLALSCGIGLRWKGSV